MVEIGGEIVVKGTKPDGSGYKIGIEGPPLNGQGPALRKIVTINQGALTTSGNYIKYLQNKNSKISHLINPKTGYPLSNQMISVTLYAKDALTADGYDNAVMAMEVNEAIRFINAKKDMEAYIVYRKQDGSVADTLTNGFKLLLKD
jgi:thiamine biosynthesis lipoprotein